MTGLLKEVGEGWLGLSSCGQHTRCLNKDPVAQANKPPSVGWCDTSHISIYSGTDLAQWYGRRADGFFHPHGKIMQLTEAGRCAVSDEKDASRAIAERAREKAEDARDSERNERERG